ncbi:hypothetical protein [Alicyclobacillus sp. SO9]|uniref:hypothetical protein n=1 Tax=Alicyclobacillus sp. SO9 TaxID=2665646 RepID=UPI0018E908FD|nr:hypothetical protein [Alicyclobacillus sp. SO9]QQE77297.1 hypothetical protein GI364_15165 [Alicyclobacillus sp. SO9]
MDITQYQNTSAVLDENSAEAGTNQTDDITSAGDSATFFCEEGKHWVSRDEALYPRAENPAICKACAAERKRQRKQTQQREEAKKQSVMGQIPDRELRGSQKRATFTLSKYALTALDVLSVGSSASEVAEAAIMSYLQSQDVDVISFVGKMFEQLATK